MVLQFLVETVLKQFLVIIKRFGVGYLRRGSEHCIKGFPTNPEIQTQFGV